MKCPKCGSEHAVKYGKACGKQRWKCKVCACQFTTEHSYAHSLEEKLFAMTLLVSGLSMNAVAGVLGVSTQTVLRWKNSGLIPSEKINKALRVRRAARSKKIKMVESKTSSGTEGNLKTEKLYLSQIRLPSGVCVDIAVKKKDKRLSCGG